MVQRRRAAADRRLLRPGATVAVAPGRRPREHDAGARPAHRRAARVRARAAVLHARRDRRGVRRDARGGEPDPAAVADEASGASTSWRSSRRSRRRTRPIRIQRWSVRRVALTLWVLLLAFLVLGARRVELERVRVIRRGTIALADRRHRRSRSPAAPPEAAAGRPCAPRSTTASSSCSLSRSRPRRELPCVAEFPAGWTFGGSDISSGSARFWLDSDRGGDPRSGGLASPHVRHHRRRRGTAGARRGRKPGLRASRLAETILHGRAVPACSRADASDTRSVSRAAPHRRSRSRPIEAISMLPRATTIVA